MKILFFVLLDIGLAQCWIYEYATPVSSSQCVTRYQAPGNCKSIRECPHLLHAVTYFTREYWPENCGFEGLDPKVCCPDADLRPSERACQKLEENLKSGHLKVPTIKAAPKEYTWTIQVFHGEEAPKGSHPHMVVLGYRSNERSGEEYNWRCGGTLISESYVLTAAHCVANLGSGAPDVVWIGAHDLSEKKEGEVIPIEEYKVHPLHSPASHYHDIALLKVKNVVLGEYALPACLYGAIDDPNELEVLGWGATDQDAVNSSEKLQRAYLKSVSQDRCNKTYVRKNFPKDLQEGIIRTQICAEGKYNDADSCLGDSGGPLQTERATDSSNPPLQSVVGITSFGQLQTCGTIGVYTRVASYLEWIESIVWPQEQPLSYF